jgi:D-alanine--poly(phosphoribitol) ligase subunit 1
MLSLYYNKINNNLKTTKCFYKYNQINYTYQDSFKYVNKILPILKKNKNIFTYSNKSFEMYSSIFPILISGSTWIPISINLPINKIKIILQKVKPDLLLYDFDNKEVVKLFREFGTKCIHYKKVYKLKKKKNNINNKIKKLSFSKTAFIYFTSGSTGDPKGIKISHKNIITDIFEQKKHLYKNIKNLKQLIFADYYDTAFSIFFDIYFPAIYFNASISPALLQEEIFLPTEHIKKNNVNVIVAVPSTIQRIINYHKKNNLFKIKILIITGEPFYLALLKKIFKLNLSMSVFNCYGGTEMGNWVFFHKCQINDVKKYSSLGLVPIGKPFSKVSAKIVNDELVVRGPMITKGYLDKNLNYKKFIFSKNNTFYTSDKVIKLKNNIFFCKGRIDSVVKIRGYRVELSEIESAFRDIKYIKDVLVFHNSNKLKKYENYIIAVVSFRIKIKEYELRKLLSRKLSYYMIPAKIFIVNDLPTNVNGKIDRNKIKKKYC